MKRVNFLKSIPRSRSPLSGVAKILVAALVIAALPSSIQPKLRNLPTPEKPALTASREIPKFVRAPSASRLQRLESDLKTRGIGQKALSLTHADNPDSGVEITLASDSLFLPGSAAFDLKNETELRSLIQWITARNDGLKVVIESHTDDTPVLKHRKVFRTNWDLSAARAGAVADVFQESLFPKSSLQAIGLADSQPLGTDRHLNRRIVLRFTDQTQGGG